MTHVEKVDPASIGDLARELRLLKERAGLSLSRLATRAWCSRSALERYLNAKVFPPRDTVRAISDACGGDTPAMLALWERAWSAREGAGRGPSPGRERTVPAQLPPDSRTFTGRLPEIARLDATLAEQDGDTGAGPGLIIAIAGMAGVGKTALAVHFGHRVADRFPDGQLYLDLRGYATAPPVSTVEALGWLLRGLGVPPERIPPDEQEQAALYRSVLAGKRVLVMLDNARGAAQVAPLLPASRHSLVVITSRSTLSAVDGATHVPLETLSERDALALLTQVIGADRVAADPVAARNLVALCAGLPLAVRIAAARLTARPMWTMDTLVDRLADQTRRLDELRAGDRAVRASFAVTYQALTASEDPADRQAARLFRLLGALDWVRMTVPVAAALLDQPQPETAAALERLVDDHLLDSPAPGRYRTHDLLRLYARDLAQRDESERRAALTRALDRYLAAAEQATLVLNPMSDRVAADPTRPRRAGLTLSTPADVTAWTDAEHANLIAAIASGVTEAAAVAVRLVTALDRPFDARGYWQDMVSLDELAASTARRIGDRVGEAYVHHDLGWIYARMGDADAAIAATRRALALYRDIGDRRGELGCLTHLGFALRQQNRLDEASTHHRRALDLCREVGHRAGEAANLDGLGIVHQKLRRFAEAIGLHSQALAIERETGHRDGEASALVNLGWAHHRAGEHDQAFAYFHDSLTLARELGSRYQQAEGLWGLGNVHHARGDLDQARTCWQHSIDILCDTGQIADDEAQTLRRQPIPDTPEIIRNNT